MIYMQAVINVNYNITNAVWCTGCELFAVPLMVLQLWLDVVLASCLQGDTSANMTLISVTSIRSTKFRDGFFHSLFVCASQCVQEATCYYMTVSDKDQLCAYYSLGSTYYNVTQLKTYVITAKSVEVSLNRIINWS